MDDLYAVNYGQRRAAHGGESAWRRLRPCGLSVPLHTTHSAAEGGGRAAAARAAPALAFFNAVPLYPVFLRWGLKLCFSFLNKIKSFFAHTHVMRAYTAIILVEGMLVKRDQKRVT